MNEKIRNTLSPIRAFIKKPEKSLSSNVVSSGFWAFALRISSRLLQFARTLVLAHILGPDDFGVMGIALLAISTAETFTQTGLGSALIQKKGKIDSYLDTSWTISVIRGFGLFGLLFLGAGPISEFFHTPATFWLIRLLAATQIANGLTNIGIIRYRKNLQLSSMFVYEFGGALADFVVAVTAAWLMHSVWALALGFAGGTLTKCLVSYLIDSHKPRLKIDRQQAQELLRYGKWISLSSVLVFLLTQGDDALAGRMLGTAALGLYQMAYTLSNIPATELTHVISQITFPLYAKLQDNPGKLRVVYLSTLQITALLTIPLAGGIYSLAQPLTDLFFGKQWLPMVGALRILCLFGVTRSIGATLGPLLQGIGKPKITSKTALLQLILLAVLIYPLTKSQGIVGTSIAVVIPNIVAVLYLSRVAAHLLKFKLLVFYRNLLCPALATAVMCAILRLLTNLSHESMLGFLLTIMMGAVSYLVAILALDKFSSYDLIRTAKWLVSTVRPIDATVE